MELRPKFKSLAQFQAIKYLLVGGGTALSELALFQLLDFISGNPAFANIIAVIVMTAINFLLNRNTTFRSTSNPLQSLAKYLLLFLFNTTFSTFVIFQAENMGFPILLAKFGTMCCITAWNFILYKKVVFK